MTEVLIPTTGELVAQPDLSLARAPEVVLEEAGRAAKALQRVMAGKKKPVIFNGEQYLEFEDWQTVGRFYGVTSKVLSTQPVEFGGVRGFEARAVAMRSDGMEISAAESMCLNDEDKWTSRPKYEDVNGKRTKVADIPVPLFQLRSMAQTRACAKALRNVLAWVVVLAGFKPNVAEEMTGNESDGNAKPAIQPPQRKTNSSVTTPATGLRVTSVESKSGETNGKPWTFHIVKFSDTREAVTFDEPMAKLATELCKANAPVSAIIEPHPKKAGKFTLTELAKVKDDEAF